jgi:hypothetical protein
VTDDDKTLVKRLRWSASGKVGAEQARLERNAADRIEAQAARLAEADALIELQNQDIGRLREALALFGGESAIEAKQLFIRMTAAAKCSGKRKELAARHFEAARKAAIARAALGETD